MAGPSKGIRLSFLAQADQNKYEMVFTQASSGNDILSAAAAREVLSKSNIGDESLAHIWDLSNVTNEAQLTFPEFAVAMYLTSLKMTGVELPPKLPDEVRKEVQNAVLAVRNSNQSLTIQSNINTQNTGLPTGIPSNINSQHTGIPSNINVQSIGFSSNINIQSTGLSTRNPSLGLPQAAMPTGMLGNNMDFASRMMPHTASYSNTSQFQSLSGAVKIPWAVTAEEKKQYTKVFKAWDPEKKGTLSGETAKEIFSQSGLPQNVLMQIWNLSDPHNQGKLNVDEFSVAMHLIYRKLNGYNVPETLPPELVPPSTRDLTESVTKLKQTLLDDIAKKRNINNFSSSPSSPPQYKSSPPRNAVKESNDEAGYVSSARRMGPDRTRSRDPSTPVSSSYGYRGKTTRIFDLRKEIEESKKALQSLEEAPKSAVPYNDLSALDKKSIDGIKEKIRELQIEIARSGNEHSQDAWGVYIQKTAELSSVAEEEKSLSADIKYMLDVTLTGLLGQVNETEDDLMNKKISLASKGGGASPLDIIGTGPNGEVTESDRIRAKAKAMVAARMGKITGKTSEKAEIDKIKQERDEFRFYTESIQDNMRETQEALRAISLEMSMIGLDIRKQDQDQKKIEERGRFEYGESVASDLKKFISELNYDAALAKAPEVDPSFESRFPVF